MPTAPIAKLYKILRHFFLQLFARRTSSQCRKGQGESFCRRGSFRHVPFFEHDVSAREAPRNVTESEFLVFLREPESPVGN